MSAALVPELVREGGTFADLVASAPTRSLSGARDFLAAGGVDNVKSLTTLTLHLTKAEYWSLVAIGRGAGVNAAGVVGEILRGDRKGFDTAKAEEAGA